MSVSGIGSLFENNHPFRALITFSLILAAIFEAINQAFALVEKSKRELRDKVKELEEVIENLKTSSQPRKRTESNSLKYWRSLLTIRTKNEMQAIGRPTSSHFLSMSRKMGVIRRCEVCGDKAIYQNKAIQIRA